MNICDWIAKASCGDAIQFYLYLGAKARRVTAICRHSLWLKLHNIIFDSKFRLVLMLIELMAAAKMVSKCIAVLWEWYVSECVHALFFFSFFDDQAIWLKKKTLTCQNKTKILFLSRRAYFFAKHWICCVAEQLVLISATHTQLKCTVVQRRTHRCSESLVNRHKHRHTHTHTSKHVHRHIENLTAFMMHCGKGSDCELATAALLPQTVIERSSDTHTPTFWQRIVLFCYGREHKASAKVHPSRG